MQISVESDQKQTTEEEENKVLADKVALLEKMELKHREKKKMTQSCLRATRRRRATAA